MNKKIVLMVTLEFDSSPGRASEVIYNVTQALNEWSREKGLCEDVLIEPKKIEVISLVGQG